MTSDPSEHEDEGAATASRAVVAIDGPSGAGKSSVARALAQRLGYAYLDTGAMYRAVTWYLLARGVVDLHDEPVVLAVLEDLVLEIDRNGDVLVGRDRVSVHLRSQEVESRVSAVSALRGVRRRMRELQRAVARRGPIVAEGRDMGSVVFPRAHWKFYLDANVTERARRRLRDFTAAGRDVSEEEVLEEIEVRDHLDSSRLDAPLTRTDDAIYFDTTGQSLQEVVEGMARRVQQAAPESGDAS